MKYHISACVSTSTKKDAQAWNPKTLNKNLASKTFIQLKYYHLKLTEVITVNNINFYTNFNLPLKMFQKCCSMKERCACLVDDFEP